MKKPISEKIISINEVKFTHETLLHENYEGYTITTNLFEYKLGISDGQACCEQWGYYSTPDNVNDFIGTTLQRIEIADTALDVTRLEELYEGGAMFVNIFTDRGLLQFTLYNIHNGYYGHNAVLITKEGIKEEII